MAGDAPQSFDEYSAFLDAIVGAWSPERRVALAAAMAERWLPAYEAFARAEGWGDPPALRRALDAAWDHLRGGRAPTAGELSRHAALVEAATPHMDDFDAPEALAACAMVRDALDCCRSPDEAAHAYDAVVSGFHAVEPEWDMDPDAEPRLWRRAAIRKELRRQLAVIERVGAVARFDDATIAALRAAMTARDVVGPIVRRGARDAGPASYSNELVFDTYRRRMESSLKRPAVAFGALATEGIAFTEWMVRYGMRRRTISGTDMPLADVAAQRALVARNLARDATATAVPVWDPDMRWRIDMALRNPFNDALDARSVELPHGYGPSLRSLWAEAKWSGRPDADAWQHILAWARHRPAAWEREDRRRKKKRAATPAEVALTEMLARRVAWDASDDADHPWTADVDCARWRVRLNDFPDDVMYTLVVDDDAVGDFHDWPECWQRR